MHQLKLYCQNVKLCITDFCSSSWHVLTAHYLETIPLSVARRILMIHSTLQNGVDKVRASIWQLQTKTSLCKWCPDAWWLVVVMVSTIFTLVITGAGRGGVLGWASRQYVMVPGTKRKRMKTTIRWFQGFSDLMLMNLMKYYLTWHSKNKTLYCCRWEEKMANRPGQGIAQQWHIVQVWLQMGYIQFGPYSFVFKFKFLYLPMTCHNVYFSK